MTYDEYSKLLPEGSEGERRDEHVCNSKCRKLVHFDIIYEIGDTLTEESLLQTYGNFALRILSSKRILEYPTHIPGTSVIATGAWEIEYYYKMEVEGVESCIEGILNRLNWVLGVK